MTNVINDRISVQNNAGSGHNANNFSLFTMRYRRVDNFKLGTVISYCSYDILRFISYASNSLYYNEIERICSNFFYLSFNFYHILTPRVKRGN